MERSEAKKREMEGRANIIPPWSTTMQNTPKEIARKGIKGLFIRAVFYQGVSHGDIFYLKAIITEICIKLNHQNIGML